MPNFQLKLENRIHFIGMFRRLLIGVVYSCPFKVKSAESFPAICNTVDNAKIFLCIIIIILLKIPKIVSSGVVLHRFERT